MFIVLVNDSDFGTVILCFPSKVSKYGVFSGPYFTVFVLSSGKYGPEKTSYLETIQAVIMLNIVKFKIYLKNIMF